MNAPTTRELDWLVSRRKKIAAVVDAARAGRDAEAEMAAHIAQADATHPGGVAAAECGCGWCAYDYCGGVEWCAWRRAIALRMEAATTARDLALAALDAVEDK